MSWEYSKSTCHLYGSTISHSVFSSSSPSRGGTPGPATSTLTQAPASMPWLGSGHHSPPCPRDIHIAGSTRCSLTSQLTADERDRASEAQGIAHSTGIATLYIPHSIRCWASQLDSISWLSPVMPPCKCECGHFLHRLSQLLPWGHASGLGFCFPNGCAHVPVGSVCLLHSLTGVASDLWDHSPSDWAQATSV